MSDSAEVNTYYTYMDSPVGRLLIAGSGDPGHVALVAFSQGSKARGADPAWEREDWRFDRIKRQLKEYFAGRRQQFELTLEHSGTTFQVAVQKALLQIPYGETCSYKELAQTLGNPKAVRAVGHANGSNPLPIIAPCHRVLGSDGSLTGFGGGLSSKRYLLDLERRHSGLFA